MYFFLFNNGRVNCREFVEFEESGGCLYENLIIDINMKNKQVKIR